MSRWTSVIPMLTGFKNFIMKGNVVDLAVAVVMGTAFGAVVTALVNKVLMPRLAMSVAASTPMYRRCQGS